jgi:hypothetical protein
VSEIFKVLNYLVGNNYVPSYYYEEDSKISNFFNNLKKLLINNEKVFYNFMFSMKYI